MATRSRLGFLLGLILIGAGLVFSLKGDGLATGWSAFQDTHALNGDHEIHRAYETFGLITLLAGFALNIVMWIRSLPYTPTENQSTD